MEWVRGIKPRRMFVCVCTFLRANSLYFHQENVCALSTFLLSRSHSVEFQAVTLRRIRFEQCWTPLSQRVSKVLKRKRGIWQILAAPKKTKGLNTSQSQQTNWFLLKRVSISRVCFSGIEVVEDLGSTCLHVLCCVKAVKVGKSPVRSHSRLGQNKLHAESRKWTKTGRLLFILGLVRDQMEKFP